MLLHVKIMPAFAAVVASLFWAQSVAGGAQVRTQQAQHLSVPPPPAIYDPQAGPFIVRLSDRGELGDDQRGVVANAVRTWSGPTLQAFPICFRPRSEPGDRDATFSALKAVSSELKAHGAQVVVMPDGGLCTPSSPRPAWKGAHVVIMGVVRT